MCMIELADGACSVYNKRIRKARKEYRCSECGRDIHAKETYLNTFMVYDGNADTARTCEHCVVACDWLVEHCNGFLFHSVSEDIEEHIEAMRYEGDFAEARYLARIYVGMRRQWQSFKNKDQLLPVPKPRPHDTTKITENSPHQN